MSGQEEYLQIFNKDLDPLYANISNGAITWTLPENVPVTCIQYIAHLSDNNKYYYENLFSKSVAWTLPQTMYSVGKSNVSAIQKMNRAQCEAFLHIEYNEKLTHIQLDKLDEYLMYLEEGNDPESFVGTAHRYSTLTLSPKPQLADNISNTLKAETIEQRSSSGGAYPRRTSTDSYISEDSDEEGNNNNDQGNIGRLQRYNSTPSSKYQNNTSITSFSSQNESEITQDDSDDSDSDAGDKDLETGTMNDASKFPSIGRFVDLSGKTTISIQTLKEAYIRRGTLMKQAVKSRRNWKKRHFVLTEYCLLYYENNFATKAKGEYALSPDTRVETLGFLTNSTEHKFSFHVFDVKGLGNDLLLAAKTDESRKEWIEYIENVVNRVKGHTRGMITKRSNSILQGNKTKFFILNQNVLTMHPDEKQLSTIEAVFTINVTTKIDIPVAKSNKGIRRLVITNMSSTNAANNMSWDLQFSSALDFEKWKNALINCMANGKAVLEARNSLTEESVRDDLPQINHEPAASKQAIDVKSLQPPKTFTFGGMWDSDDEEETETGQDMPAAADLFENPKETDKLYNTYPKNDTIEQTNEQHKAKSTPVVTSPEKSSIVTRSSPASKLFQKALEAKVKSASYTPGSRHNSPTREQAHSNTLDQSPAKLEKISNDDFVGYNRESEGSMVSSIDDNSEDDMRYSSGSSSTQISSKTPFLAKKAAPIPSNVKIETKSTTSRGKGLGSANPNSNDRVDGNSLKGKEEKLNAIQVMALKKVQAMKTSPSNTDATSKNSNSIYPSKTQTANINDYDDNASIEDESQKLPSPPTEGKKMVPPKPVGRGSRSLFATASKVKRSLSASSKMAISTSIGNQSKSTTTSDANKAKEDAIEDENEEEDSQDEDYVADISDKISNQKVSFSTDSSKTAAATSLDASRLFTKIKPDKVLAVSMPISPSNPKPLPSPSPMSSSFNPTTKKPVTPFILNSMAIYSNKGSNDSDIPIKTQTIFLNEARNLIEKAYKDQSVSPFASPKNLSTPRTAQPFKNSDSIPIDQPLVSSPIKRTLTVSTQTDDSQHFVQESHKNTYAVLLSEREAILKTIEKTKEEEERSLFNIQLKEEVTIRRIKDEEELSRNEIAKEREKFEDYKSRTIYNFEIREKQLEINKMALERDRMEMESAAANRSKEVLHLSQLLAENYQKLIEEKYELTKQRFQVDILLRQLTYINQELYQYQYQQRLHQYYQIMKPTVTQSMKGKSNSSIVSAKSSQSGMKTYINRHSTSDIPQKTYSYKTSKTERSSKKSTQNMLDSSKPPVVSINLKSFTINPDTNRVEMLPIPKKRTTAGKLSLDSILIRSSSGPNSPTRRYDDDPRRPGAHDEGKDVSSGSDDDDKEEEDYQKWIQMQKEKYLSNDTSSKNIGIQSYSNQTNQSKHLESNQYDKRSPLFVSQDIQNRSSDMNDDLSPPPPPPPPPPPMPETMMPSTSHMRPRPPHLSLDNSKYIPPPPVNKRNNIT